MSALAVHQSLTMPQKTILAKVRFDAKRGSLWNVGKMNIYFYKSPFAPLVGLFSAKCEPFWC